MKNSQKIHPRWLLMVLASGVTLTSSQCSRDEPCVRGPSVVTVGEKVRLRVGQMVASDCRTDLELSGYAWTVEQPRTATPWEDKGPRVAVLSDNVTLVGLAQGPFHIAARRGTVVLADAGVVLPVGWTMKLVPENATLAIGESKPFRVQVFDRAGNHLAGIGFSVFETIGSQILRGPGLVASTESVTYTGNTAGTTTLTGYLGNHAVKTSVTVVPPASHGAGP